jgi:hypothetical protein
MTRSTIPNGGDPAVLIEHLQESGVPGPYTVDRAVDGTLEVDAPMASQAELDAAIATFVPSEVLLLPAAARSHVPHIRAFFDAERSGAQAAKSGAQRLSEAEHVIADMALILRLMVDARL